MFYDKSKTEKSPKTANKCLVNSINNNINAKIKFINTYWYFHSTCAIRTAHFTVIFDNLKVITVFK